MAPKTYEVKKFILRDLDSPRHRKWDLLDREDKMFLFRKEDDPILNASQKRLEAKTATLKTDFVTIEAVERKEVVNEDTETSIKKISQ